ncbi:hypothetical protein [Geobacter sp. AOG1]|uniref:hypothetical protein n=1 Tax=Geobacter sp. AOG1 TaxID=1566346 RepID=UPI001CC6FF04|nr:hypothetical protein [Geobacter sp. AOG1]GFE59118.1 hypothetical protein AOG1_29980 [Geobacter sp. AOG1]
MKSGSPSRHPLFLVAWVALLALFFAMTEIQIEGAHGWAASLPTWRIEKHWLLDIFWGGRPMTGYHAWVFPFMLLAFHLPLALHGTFSWRLEARCLGALMLFWIMEDLLWFLLNPAYGWAKFTPLHIPWHKHWLAGFPLDYLVFILVGGALLAWSFRRPMANAADNR